MGAAFTFINNSVLHNTSATLLQVDLSRYALSLSLSLSGARRAVCSRVCVRVCVHERKFPLLAIHY